MDLNNRLCSYEAIVWIDTKLLPEVNPILHSLSDNPKWVFFFFIVIIVIVTIIINLVMVTIELIKSERMMMEDKPKKKNRKRYVTGVGQKAIFGDLIIHQTFCWLVSSIPKKKREDRWDKLCWSWWEHTSGCFRFIHWPW